MLRLILLAGLAASPAAAPAPEAAAKERVWVVQRDKGALAVLEGGARIAEIGGLGTLSHATVKFHRGAAYVVSRDGYLSKIDVATLKLLKKVKVGESGIGLDFVRTPAKDFVAVANYAPPEVVVLDLDLEVHRRIPTGSRNVGIKSENGLLVFSLMDKDQVWVLDAKEDFKVVKKIEQGGVMPFDALLSDGAYLVGFFNEPSLGHLDLKSLTWSKRRLAEDGKELTLKVPHFGTWGVTGASKDRVFVPAVGARALHLVDLNRFAYLGKVELGGTPVFAVVSPDGKQLAVNFSGEHENFVAIVDPVAGKVVRELEAGRRVMHLRFSSDSKTLYVSSYFDNVVKAFDTARWVAKDQVEVASPSGLFLAAAKGAER
jgi:protein NirF